MTIVTEHPHVVRDSDILGGEPIISGTRTPVRAIVDLWRLGITPEEIPVHLPHLSLGQVFDALGYYADHRNEIDEHARRNEVPDQPLTSGTRVDA